jgi:ArsR family transcriptional regulator, arsenate/arsenite/antimonite-responsive transcriptional repressor
MSTCSQTPDAETLRVLEELLSHHLFKALADPNRIRLLLLLAERCRTCSVGELAGCLTVDVSVVSRHLAILRAAGVLKAKKQGKEVHYALQYEHLAETLRGIGDAIGACAPRFEREPRQLGQESDCPNGQ